MDKLKAALKTRPVRAGIYSVLAILLVIAIAIVANGAVSALPVSYTRLDMTREQIYSISPETEQTLATLDRDVTVYWLAPAGQENNTLSQVLAKYAQYEHVTVTQVDPVRYPGFAAAYTDETVQPNSLLVVCGDRSMYIPYTDIWTYSDFDAYYDYLYYYGEEYLDVFQGEGKLTGAIRYAVSDHMPVLYYLTGHGEVGVSASVRDAVALENVQVEALSLLTEEAVPDDCSLLALLGPTRDLSDRERELICDYISAGGKMLITTAYTTVDMPNFDAILAQYGLGVVQGCVMEQDSRYYNYGYIDLVLPTLADHAITHPLREGGYIVMMPDAQALEALPGDPDLTVMPLLSSSDSSYLKPTLENITDYDKAAGDLTGPFVLAAVSDNDATGAQAVVFTATDFVEPEYSDAVAGANRDLFLNAIGCLAGQEQTVSIHPKVLSSDYLTFSASAANLVRILLVIVVPVLFLGAGVVIFMGRRRR